MIFLKRIVFIFYFSIFLSNSLFAGLLYGVRLWSSFNDMRFVFDLSTETDAQIFTLKNPNRLVIDLNNTVNTATNIDKLSIEQSLISNIRIAYNNEVNFRIVFDLNQEVEFNTFKLQPDGVNPFRIVLDVKSKENFKSKYSKKENSTLLDNTFNKEYNNKFLYDKRSNSSSSPINNKSSDIIKSYDIQNNKIQVWDIENKIVQKEILGSKKKDIVIVIDPGHGGKDPGAISADKKIYEKDITLSIAKKMFNRFNSLNGFRAYLTRDNDVFIPLKERNDIARKYKADLFVSIHADAAPSKFAHGASIYALSPKGATSKIAQFLAEKENASDLIGGILVDKDLMLANILLDLSLNSTIASSLDVGSHILKYMSKFVRLHKSQVEQAGFVVLKSPDIPSILVEAGFISNDSESKKLLQDKHQINIVNSIVDGVIDFYKKVQPANTIFDRKIEITTNTQNFIKKKSHTVKKGDTLHSISRQYSTEVNLIKKKNNLQDNVLYINQKLILP